MSISEIKEIIKLFNETDIGLLKFKNDEFSLHLQKNIDSKDLPASDISNNVAPTISQAQVQLQAPQTAPAVQVQESAPNNKDADFITSPVVGTFYRAPSPGAAPYVSVGDKVKKGQVIGIIEAMKIMNEIEADFDCTILEFEVNDAQPVEYGSKLVMVSKA